MCNFESGPACKWELSIPEDWDGRLESNDWKYIFSDESHYKELWKGACGLARRAGCNATECEEIASASLEVTFKEFQRQCEAGRFQEKPITYKLRTYIWAIHKLNVLDELEKRNRLNGRTSTEFEADKLDELASVPLRDPVSYYIFNSMLGEAIQDCLRMLRTELRRVFCLYRFEELTWREVNLAMGWEAPRTGGGKAYALGAAADKNMAKCLKEKGIRPESGGEV